MSSEKQNAKVISGKIGERVVIIRTSAVTEQPPCKMTKLYRISSQQSVSDTINRCSSIKTNTNTNENDKSKNLSTIRIRSSSFDETLPIKTIQKTSFNSLNKSEIARNSFDEIQRINKTKSNIINKKLFVNEFRRKKCDKNELGNINSAKIEKEIAAFFALPNFPKENCIDKKIPSNSQKNNDINLNSHIYARIRQPTNKSAKCATTTTTTYRQNQQATTSHNDNNFLSMISLKFF